MITKRPFGLDRQAGLTLVELMVTLAIFGFFGLIAATILSNANTIGRASELRRGANAVISQSKFLFVKRFEQRAPGDSLVPALRPGNQRAHLENELSISRRLSDGSDTVTFATKCRKTPVAVTKSLNKAGLSTNLKSILLSPNRDSLGSICRPAKLEMLDALRCKQDERPVLSIRHNLVRSAKKETKVFEFPSAKSPSGEIAGGFCVVRSATLEYTVAFQQVLLAQDRLVFRKNDLLVTINDDGPYAAGKGIVYMPPSD